jgi:hypothetical protein
LQTEHSAGKPGTPATKKNVRKAKNKTKVDKDVLAIEEKAKQKLRNMKKGLKIEFDRVTKTLNFNFRFCDKQYKVEQDNEEEVYPDYFNGLIQSREWNYTTDNGKNWFRFRIFE